VVVAFSARPPTRTDRPDAQDVRGETTLDDVSELLCNGAFLLQSFAILQRYSFSSLKKTPR
jgi:hypothetical protein